MSRSTALLPVDPRFEARRLRRLERRAAGRRPRLPDGAPRPFFADSPAMRPRPAVPKAAGDPPLPPLAVIALSRMGFGPRPGDVDAFQDLAGSDAARLAAHVEAQLHPETIDDAVCDAKIAAAGFTTLGKSLAQLWADHVVPDDLEWEERVRPLDETELATYLRAVWSKRQLFELLTGFWHDHFNVYAHDFPHAAVWVHSDRDAIRPHVFGRFRTMLEAVAKTPAMLYYLDNFVNTQEDANENYGREMLELHAMGSDAYLGSLPAAEVPLDAQGFPEGYVEEDVVQAARCLTGWTVSDRDWDPEFGNTGTFLYYAPWHDTGAKTVLGLALPADQPPLEDGQDLFDRVCRHPATGRHVARKLCRRLVSDQPPQALVDEAAAVFTAHVDSPDQLRRVVRTILLSSAFATTWGRKVKRPFDVAVSALRASGVDLPFTRDDPATGWFLWMVYQTGQPLFGWHPPNGYPDSGPVWSSTSPRVASWRLPNMLAVVETEAGVPYLDVLAQTPAGVRSARELVEHWALRALGRPAQPDEEAELVSFMAQGHNPDFDLDLGDEETVDRLRALVALILMTPSFLWR